MIKKLLSKMGYESIGEIGLPSTKRDNCLVSIVYLLIAILIVALLK